MKISNLKVNGLFGLYDYEIDFRRKDDDFTVLTSPNGYGKTTILRLINSLDVKRLYYLYLIKFTRLYFYECHCLSLQFLYHLTLVHIVRYYLRNKNIIL